MKIKKLSDILVWIALVVIIIWIILKITGIINSPLWIEYIPIYSAVYIAGWQINKLANVAEEVKNLNRFKTETIKQISQIKEKL